VLRPPVSKSDAHRALVLRAILAQPLATALGPDRPLDAAPADVRVLAHGLEALARPRAASIDCADGGAPFRFLLTQAAIRDADGAVTLTGTPRLGARPHGPLVDALRRALGPAGLRIDEGDPWPVVVRGASSAAQLAPTFAIDGTRSSQFASSLLLGCAALARREQRAWSIVQEGDPLTSLGYLDLTVRWLERAGFAVSREGRRISAAGPVGARELPPPPGDWSSIGYLLALAWKTGSAVLDVDPGAEHPDRAILDVLAAAGIAVTVEGTTARVRGAPRRGLRASGEVCPDLLPTVAAWACVLPAPSVLEHVDVLRDKESDRLAAIEELVTAAGGGAELEGSTLRLTPPRRVRAPLVVASRADHRVAMAAATLAVLAGVPLHLDDAACVAKSFPGFWVELERLGGTVERRPRRQPTIEEPPCA
jgi:3-phosphoshikimate 1-carboxyvinyltransferase